MVKKISSEALKLKLTPKDDSTVLDVQRWKKENIVSNDMGFDGVEGVHVSNSKKVHNGSIATNTALSLMPPQINKKITLYNFTKRNSLSRIKYIVIHFVGGVSTAKNNADYFYDKYVGASAHYFVDPVSIWQSVYDSDDAWHCGTKSGYYHPECRNSNSIGIELCCKQDANDNWYFEEDTVQNAIELVKTLKDKYNVPINNILRHYDVTGKLCPAPFVRDSAKWVDFKREIEEEINMKQLEDLTARLVQLESDNKKYNTIKEIPDWAKTTVNKLIKAKYIVGDEKGNLGLKNSDIRLLVMLDRAGVFDK